VRRSTSQRAATFAALSGHSSGSNMSILASIQLLLVLGWSVDDKNNDAFLDFVVIT